MRIVFPPKSSKPALGLDPRVADPNYMVDKAPSDQLSTGPDRPPLPLPGRLENVFGENADDAFDEIDELLERWNDRLSIDNLALAKRYAEGRIEILFVWSSTEMLGASYYVTVFQRVDGLLGREGQGDFWQRHPLNHQSDFPNRSCMGKPDRNDGGMLIENVQIVETPEGICPSRVWFQPLHKTPCVGTGTSKIVWEQFFKSCLAGTYWEIGVLQNVFTRSAISNREGSGKIVEAGPEVMNDVANSASPIARDQLSVLDPIEALSRLRVFIDDDVVRLSREKGADFGPKLVKVLLGPVDLYPNAEKRISCHG